MSLAASRARPPADALPAAAGAPVQPTISVRGLSVAFPTLHKGSVPAISDLDLDIMPGEIVGLVGEAGSGKTVLARALLRLVPEPGQITAGSILYQGRDYLALNERQLQAVRGRSISLIAANPRGELNPLRTVGRQIETVVRVHMKVSRVEARRMALDMLKAVQIPDPERRLNAYPHELSGGMAQRIVIAIALICSPQFVVADDATSGLDVTVQAQVLDLLRGLMEQRGSSLLFITRDVGITAHFCDRVAVIYRGEIIEMAGREDFFLRPRHPYTIMLMAAFSHNSMLRKAWTQPSAAAKAATPGAGCTYATRCPRAAPLCATTKPAPAAVAPGHIAACHFPVDR